MENTDYTRGNTAQLMLRNCEAMLHAAPLQGQTISGSIPFQCSSLPATPPTGTYGAPILSQGLRFTQNCPCTHYEATWGGVKANSTHSSPRHQVDVRRHCNAPASVLRYQLKRGLGGPQSPCVLPRLQDN